jgi:hypothetical protein
MFGTNIDKVKIVKKCVPLCRLADVRFGSKADMCVAKRHVRFTPNSDRKSRHAAMVMSALPPKADSCRATAYVCFGPIAEMTVGSDGATILLPSDRLIR